MFTKQRYLVSLLNLGIIDEGGHFTLAEEPYPDTYFNFPIKLY